MTAPGAIVLAHNDPVKVRRLLAALGGLDVYLHCDRRTPPHIFAAMMRDAAPNVHLLPRTATRLSSWSLVEAELRALRVWLRASAAEHVIVLSGACYPLVPAGEIADELADWGGRSRMPLNPLPHERWSTRRNPDGGLWRMRRRFVTFRGQIVFIAGKPLPTYRREAPKGLVLCASAQWKVYARRHVIALLRVLDERPDLERFWRTTFVPDESCVASILSSPDLVGDLCEQVCDDLPWYLDWSVIARGGHPRSLTLDDLPSLAAARRAPRRPPERFAADREGYRKLFARKVSSAETALLDAIDELRAGPR
ncbi:MAG TPA: beta-1,6-N-acetylglucosaminyltransferase [Thermoleophilia bacterium]|nr:beta-1,6-N-acetylglucosaminyltransferase [Thermoleophilia bacterium]